MGSWPSVLEGQRAADNGALTASSTGTVITAGAANTKGSWTQLIASTVFDFGEILIAIGQPSTSVIVDIGIGAAASEVALIPNLRVAFGSTAGNRVSWVGPLPCSVPVGTRLAARSQSATASATCQVVVYGFG